MTVSDPLLRELKGFTLKVLEYFNNNGKVLDDCPALPLFCQTIERIFQKGLRHYQPRALFWPLESWQWLEQYGIQHDGPSTAYKNSVQVVQHCCKTVTAVGKLRLLIRVCLNRRCLHEPIGVLVRGSGAVEWYEEHESIIGDPVLGEIFLSVLLQCSHLKFELNIKNALFLDETWLMPAIEILEMVPCKQLGLSLLFVRGKAMVVRVQSESIAAEDSKVRVGDIIDELNGQHVGARARGRLTSMMRKGSGRPVMLQVVRVVDRNTGTLYPPAADLLRQAHLDPVEVLSSHQSNLPSASKSATGRMEITYVGSVSMGQLGGVEQIEGAMTILAGGPREKRPVVLECGELGVRVSDRESGDIVLQHSYMEISSCGCYPVLPGHFALIAGNEHCNVAQEFRCYVFRCLSEGDTRTILQSINQGFHRTHFAV